MNMLRLAGAVLVGLLSSTAAAAQEGPLLRLFLKDGTSLVSFGEAARVDDRVIFSMPTSLAASNPDLHLVTILAEQVDWEKTTSYTESARATRYLSTRAEADYALLTADIAQALNDVALTNSPAERLIIVQKARKALADWPSSHFNFKQDEIHQMLGTLDEAIADLRAATGAQQFDLALIADTSESSDPPQLLPPPTLQESIEQMLLAASLTPSVGERMSLLAVAATALDRDEAELPAAWVASTRETTKSAIGRELNTDRAYHSLTTRMVQLAGARARAANVRGVERLIAEIRAEDEALGQARPDAVNALVASVEEQLDGARRLRLARDRWAMRLPELRRYERAIQSVVDRLVAMKSSLEDIKALSGSTHGTLATLQATARRAMRSITLIPAPDEYRDVHALLASAAQLANSAAGIRREAVLAGNIARAWDASSAAAGAMLLTARAQSEIMSVLRQPQLSR
jgi:hypothetical protein